MYKTKNRITKSILIDAPIENVWNVLLGDATFRKWASVFCEGSYAESDWKEGSTALFKDPNGNGLISRVRIHNPNDLIVFEHIGIFKDGEEDYQSKDALNWIGKQESYRVEIVLDKTNLEINQDIPEKYFEFFYESWDKALMKIKELAEA